jgi:hypothetical protein
MDVEEQHVYFMIKQINCTMLVGVPMCAVGASAMWRIYMQLLEKYKRNVNVSSDGPCEVSSEFLAMRCGHV